MDLSNPRVVATIILALRELQGATKMPSQYGGKLFGHQGKGVLSNEEIDDVITQLNQSLPRELPEE